MCPSSHFSNQSILCIFVVLTCYYADQSKIKENKKMGQAEIVFCETSCIAINQQLNKGWACWWRLVLLTFQEKLHWLTSFFLLIVECPLQHYLYISDWLYFCHSFMRYLAAHNCFWACRQAYNFPCKLNRWANLHLYEVLNLRLGRHYKS